MVNKKEKLFLAKFFTSFFIPFFLLELIDTSLLTNAIAGFENYFLSKLVYTELNGSTIFANNILFQIVTECSGLVMLLLFASLIYSTEAKNKLKNFLLLAPVVFVFNLLRLFVTLLFGVFYGQQAIEVVHVLFWFIDAGVVFLLWMHVVGITPNQVFKQVKKSF
ncbi:exosortase/archaeosortase family protein [Candidatus Micrarchaeota archaeon]|nr:exosortase/archaeosortase family protein [Candidatus Micrarchaeota archaeon]